MSYIEELAATRKALVGNEIFFFFFAEMKLSNLKSYGDWP